MEILNPTARRALLVAGGLALAFICAISAARAEGLPEAPAPFALSPAELLEASKAVAADEKFSAVWLYDYSRYSFDERLRVTQYAHHIYRLESAAAVLQYGEISAAWDPTRQERPVFRARVVTPDGQSHALDPSTVSDETMARDNPLEFADTRILRAPLPSLEAGSVVEVETTIVDREPQFEAGTADRVFVGINGRVERTIIRVEAPEAVPLRFATRGLPAARVTDEKSGGRRAITLSQGPTRVDFAEIFLEAAGDQSRLPEFLFSTGGSWQSVAASYDRRVAPLIRPDEVQKLLPANLPSDRTALVEALLNSLRRKVRYTAVFFGEGRIIPNSPAVTLARGFGDCKDMAVTLTSMLRAVGIPAQLALLNAGTSSDLDPELPGLGVFNHVIVHVPGDQPLWIDPTEAHLQGGQLPFADASRWALLVASEDASLVRTPDARAADHLTSEEIEVRIADFGNGELRVKGRQNGVGAAIFRQYLGESSGADRKQLEDIIQRMYGAKSISNFNLVEEAGTGFIGYDINLFKVTGVRTDLENAVVQLSMHALFSEMPYGLRGPEHADEADEMLVFPRPADTGPRTADWVFEPYQSEWLVKVLAPTGFRLKALPPNRELGLGPAKFMQNYSLDADGNVIASVRLDTGAGRYTAEQGKAFTEEFKKLFPDLMLELHYDHEAALLLEAGDEAGAMRRDAELVAADPGKAVHRTRAARRLLELGLVEEAQAEAVRATKVDPKDSVAFIELGALLEFDELGRRFGRGFDRAAAMRAHRESIRLDPENFDLNANLATLSELNADGVRFGPGADLESAAATYRMLADKRPGVANWNGALMECLWRLKKYDEVISLAAKLKDDTNASRLRLAARVMSSGPAAALNEETGRVDATTRRARTVAAINTLWAARNYDEARALIEASGIDMLEGDDAVWARMLDRTKHEESLPTPPDTAVGAAESVMRLVMVRDADAKAIQPWISERARFGTDPDWLAKSVVTVGKYMNARIGRAFGDNPPFIRDILLSNFEFQEAETTTEARQVAVLMSGLPVVITYFVPERKGWRLLAIAPFWQPFGKEALSRLDAGDLPGARVWLELAREDMESAGSNPSSVWAGYFARALPRTAPQTDEPAMRLAAIILLVGQTTIGTDLETMRAGAANAATDEQRVLWQSMIAQVARETGDTAEMVAAAERAHAIDATADDTFSRLANAYERAERWTEAERISRERLASRPNDQTAHRALIDALNGQGRAREGLEMLALAVRGGRANPGQLNNFAWQALVAESVDATAVEAAENSYNAQNRRNFASAHTLACVYAANGQILDARRVLLKMLEDEPMIDPLIGEFWLIRGLIAENLGATEAAIKAYGKMERPEPSQSDSSYLIGAARLAKLQQASK